MKGVSVNQLRVFITAILDKTSNLLKAEPARAIGYGAAVVLYLVVRVLNAKGYVQFGQLTFEESIVATLAAMTVISGVVESIRRFVFSPQTYIEDLADSYVEGHISAHDEMDLRAQFEAAMLDLKAQREEAATKVVIPVGFVPTNEKPN